MPWARFDERFPKHRRIRKLSDAAFRLQVSGICYSSEYLTDGRIAAEDLDDVADIRKPQAAAAELVTFGRWHLPGHDCDSQYCYPITDGWLIHNYLEFNPSREHVLAEREAAKERQRRAREKRDQARKNAEQPPKSQRESRRDKRVTNDEARRESQDSDPTRPDPYTEPTVLPATSADVALTVTQRSKAITDAYHDAEPMSKWPAVNGIVIKAIQANRWTDLEIRDALLRLAKEGRSVTVDSLRTELNGLPPARARPSSNFDNHLALIARLEAGGQQ